MSITTKIGDKGRTSLLRGGMVSKDDALIYIEPLHYLMIYGVIILVKSIKR